MINIQNLCFLSFGLFILLDSLILNNYLGLTIKKYYLKFLSLRFIYQFIIVFNLVFIILSLFSFLDVYLIDYTYFNKLFESDLYNYMTDSNNPNKSGVHDNTVNNTVNLNHPRLNVSVPSRAINNIAGALSSAAQGGAALGYKAAQNFPGSPAAKLALG
jgi:hypothetical protein